ncbi:MAG: hypothetical protein KBG54_04910 [Oscillospiraceae bacterium]|nr:hypothetical protein [Oscillospiraceae bacterium]
MASDFAFIAVRTQMRTWPFSKTAKQSIGALFYKTALYLPIKKPFSAHFHYLVNILQGEEVG